MPARSRWLVGSSIRRTSGRLRDRPRDRRPPPLAAAGGFAGAVEIEPELVRHRLHLMHRRRARPGQRELAQRGEIGHRRILLEQDHLRPRLNRPPPLIGLDQIGEALEQSRLPDPILRPINANRSRSPIKRVEIAEQPAGALDQAEIFIGKGRGRAWPRHKGDRRIRHPAGLRPLICGIFVPCGGRSSSTLLRWRSRRRGSSGCGGAIWRMLSRPRFTSPFSRLASSRLGSGGGQRLTPGPRPAAFVRNDAAVRSLGLSPRECEILAMLASGQSNKEMARALGISPNTVKTHLAGCSKSSRLQKRVQAIETARRLR